MAKKIDNSKYRREFNLTKFQQDLEKSIFDDKIRSLRNDAKIRAVVDKNITYEQFEDIVKAAHLKPLDKKTDKILTKDKSGTIFNPVAAAAIKSKFYEEKIVSDSTLPIMDLDSNSHYGHGIGAAVADFVRRFKRLKTPEERYLMLKAGGVREIEKTFGNIEIPVGIFGEILEALATFPLTDFDIVLVVNILECLATTKRFSLSLEFLTLEEKSKANHLMDKLANSLKDRQQDLAENGVTEYNITNLKKKYLSNN